MNIQALLDAAAVQTEGYQMGLRTGLSLKQRTMENVLRLYDRALQDKDTKIPTYLHAMLELMRTEVENDASMLAEPAIRAAKAVMPGTPDQDRSTFGMQIRAGA